MLRYQSELIQSLRDEIAILKGQKPKPKIKPSGMNEKSEKTEDQSKSDNSDKRPGSAKRKKTAELEIHETKVITAEVIPEGSVFKGYKDFVVQGIVIETHNTIYRMERWQTPDGTYVEGNLPASVQGHFDSTLVSFILYQYHQCHVTQPLLLEQLGEYGVDISAGQLNQILNEDNKMFHKEKDDIIVTGLAVSSYIQVDDTGARHQGNNGVCTHIGNGLFAWFKSTDSKSRINFLELLRADRTDYHLNEDALSYMQLRKLPVIQFELLKGGQIYFADKEQWEAHLKKLDISQERHIRIATEGVLIGGLFEHGFNRNLVILSDDAGQFNILLHALCWVHAERTIYKIIPFNEDQRLALETIRKQIWDLYFDLKAYKICPSIAQKVSLEKRFDKIFQEQTCFVTLNLALKRLYSNRVELLLVLDRPDIPIQNNASESDIREYAKRRKVSGGTRSASGRRSRDTFTSLKKTCRKLGVSFWVYLKDRITGTCEIPDLSVLIRQKAGAAT